MSEAGWLLVFGIVCMAFAAGFCLGEIEQRNTRKRQAKIRAADRKMDLLHGDNHPGRCPECGILYGHNGYCSKSLMRGGA